MEYVVELVKALAWPVVAIIAIFTIRSGVSGLIRRVTKASLGTDGLRLEAPAQAAAAEQKVEGRPGATSNSLPIPPEPGKAPSVAHEHASLPPPHFLYDSYDASLHGRLNELFGTNEQAKLAWAVRMFDQAAIELAHERHYRLFFTSQIIAVRRLNEMIRAPVALGRELFDDAARQNPTAYQDFSFEAWLTFLRNTGYIAIEGEGDQSIASITNLGKGFLAWMVGRGVPETKPY